MQNEQLMSSLKRMTMRIKELEVALADTQSHVSPQPHPLLRDGKKLTDADVEFLLDGGSPRIKDDASDLIGSLSIGEKGQSKYHGQSSASEVCLFCQFGLGTVMVILVSSSSRRCFR